MTSKRDDYMNWNETFMSMAVVVSQRSKDPSTQVGCCIVDDNNIVVALGYNGLPRGCSDDDFPWEKTGDFGSTKYPYIVHAELNAILNSNQSSLKNTTMYVTRHPCNECAKSIIQVGIKKIYYLTNPLPNHETTIASVKMLTSANISIEHLPTDNLKQHFTNFNDLLIKLKKIE